MPRSALVEASNSHDYLSGMKMQPYVTAATTHIDKIETTLASAVLWLRCLGLDTNVVITILTSDNPGFQTIGRWARQV